MRALPNTSAGQRWMRETETFSLNKDDKNRQLHRSIFHCIHINYSFLIDWTPFSLTIQPAGYQYLSVFLSFFLSLLLSWLLVSFSFLERCKGCTGRISVWTCIFIRSLCLLTLQQLHFEAAAEGELKGKSNG